jgi:glycosyltransferase involved in cell wall biosynthesis
MNHHKTWIVVPCFNEEKRLALGDFKNFSQRTQIGFIFVNDGSTDNTLKILNQNLNSSSNFKIVNLEQNVGKAEAIRLGIESIIDTPEIEYIGFWDADLATPLVEIEKMLNYFQENSRLALVMGSRIKKMGSHISRSHSRHILGRVFATTVSLMLNLPVYDTQCGAKIFKIDRVRDVFNERFISKWIFDVEIIFRLKKISNSMESILEHPLSQWTDIEGTKLKLSHLIRVPLHLVKIYMRYTGGSKRTQK